MSDFLRLYGYFENCVLKKSSCPEKWIEKLIKERYDLLFENEMKEVNLTNTKIWYERMKETKEITETEALILTKNFLKEFFIELNTHFLSHYGAYINLHPTYGYSDREIKYLPV